MRHLFLFLVFFAFILSCQNPQQKGKITIGEYTFSFPNDYKLAKEKGIDSYVGKIKGRTLWLGFDYGYYSDPLVETPKEYLEKGLWKLDAYSQFTKPDSSYTPEMARKIQLVTTRYILTRTDSSEFKGSDLIAVCKIDTSTFEYGVIFPVEIKKHDFQIDTVEGHYRKIVIAKDPNKGSTGIYLKNLNGFNESINAFRALSIATSKLTKQQQDSLVAVFQNVKVATAK